MFLLIILKSRQNKKKCFKSKLSADKEVLYFFLMINLNFIMCNNSSGWNCQKHDLEKEQNKTEFKELVF